MNNVTQNKIENWILIFGVKHPTEAINCTKLQHIFKCSRATNKAANQPVEDLVCEELARSLERTSHDPLHPLAHLFSNQLLQISD